MSQVGTAAAAPPQPNTAPSASGIALDSTRNYLLSEMAKSLTSALIASIAANSIMGNAGASSAPAVGLTQAQVFAILFASKTVTTNYTVATGDFHIRGNGTLTVTLPAKTSLSRILWITNVNAADTVTISSGDTTINGSSTLALSTQWKNALLICTDAQTWDAMVA